MSSSTIMWINCDCGARVVFTYEIGKELVCKCGKVYFIERPPTKKDQKNVPFT